MTERQRYVVLEQYPGFELRRYAAHLVAEVDVDASFTDAGNRAFGVLAGFIFGRNSTQGAVSMTSPVVQESASTTIAMTSPVVQEPGEGRHVVGFVMPAEYTVDTLPTPTDPRVRIREVPSQVAAARAFTGRWSERIYQGHLAELRHAVQAAGLEIVGQPRFARFDPPWTPWFLRHNEVVLPVAGHPRSG
jgi:hypothetical protein